MIKEMCVENFKDAMLAQEKGANRIELCENLSVGGTTPSIGTVKICLKKLSIPVFPMIRPRGGDFFYTEEEIEIMKEDIKYFKSIGVKGIVLGVLNEDKTINFTKTKELVELAYPMEVTFHKAIDEIENPEKSLKELIEIGVKRVLTSGTKDTAIEGIEIIKKMIEEADEKIKIVVAGKVTKDNLEKLSKILSTDEFHGRKIV